MNKKMLLTLVAFLCAYQLYAQKRPNIVVILSDDAGYADFGFMTDRLVPTPNIDRIAHEGAKFTNAYVTAAVCVPSRAGLLSGMNQATFGHTLNYVKGATYSIKKEDYGIPQNVKLVSNYLKPMGYQTAILGKWHEGFSKPYYPTSRGFDYFWGFLWGSSQYTAGTATEVEENEKPIDGKTIPYMTDAIGNKAVEFITQADKQKPFFVYVAFNAVHGPLQAKKEDIERFKDKFTDKKRLTLAAMTHCLDQNVGKIFKALEDQKLLDNTIIVFTNDNGGSVGVTHADNYPLRGAKADIWEGGIRVPMAIRWPNHIGANTVSDVPVTTLDFIPTFLDANGEKLSKYPQLQGQSLLPIINTPQTVKNLMSRNLFWYLNKGRGAVRQGNWKLVVQANKAPELYNLKNDIAETTNLYDKEPKLAKKLLSAYEKWEKALPPVNYYNINRPNGADEDK